MSELTPRDQALVGLAAAIGSNCVPCVEHHVPMARQAGLTNAEIAAAIAHADKIRQVPARKVLESAMQSLASSANSVAACQELAAESLAPVQSSCC